MRARIDWAGNMRFLGSTENGQSIIMEASKSDGAKRIGASPMEVVLIGMGGCASYDVVHILKKMRHPVKDLWCDMQASRVNDVPAVFDMVHMTFTVVGNIPLKKAEEAVRLSIKKYCSASKMISSTAKITTNVKIKND